jgi:16S rRNA (cytosine967-C5)-methyltransferase
MRALWRDLQHLTDTYQGERPLIDFLKSYFKQHHRLGSRDRKLITEALFSWYRASDGFPEALAFEDKMKACIRLCGTEPRLSGLMGDDSFDPQQSFPDRLKQASGAGFLLERLLPETIAFSAGIDREEWLQSVLVQPRLFIRLRPAANRKTLLPILEQAGIPYEELTLNCFSLPANIPLHTLWPQNAFTVQDWGSQQVCGYLQPQPGESWWDTCAGGGGKSLFLKDAVPELRLLASDVRPQALRALETRFKVLNTQVPQTRIMDASDGRALETQVGLQTFDAIVSDVPCSGSGTWARTPEMRYFFKEDSLAELSRLQTRIAINSSQYLKPGGRLMYMTCSVFQAENEGIIQNILSGNPALTLVETALQNGIPHSADSLFVAVFRKA